MILSSINTQQGMGYALMENLQFDSDTGACVNGDFLDYKIPTALEMPPKIESIFIESNEPTSPFGAKSLSEMWVIVPAAAIANAVAMGMRVHELPITPEKILVQMVMLDPERRRLQGKAFAGAPCLSGTASSMDSRRSNACSSP